MNIQDIPGIQEVHSLVAKAKIAQEKLAYYSQQEIDRIIAAMAKAGTDADEYLARMAAGETGLGRVESKTAKNRFSVTEVAQSILNLKTVGIIGYDEVQHCYEIAEPVGIIAAIIPMTNPTSTAMFKSLISIKARNVVIFAPHPKAVHCTAEAVKILHDAAVAAGAPANCLQCVTQVSLNITQELMTHPDVDFILATGGPGLVKAAYQSGKPAIGVGQGNAPVYIDRSAAISYAARCIIESKTFDYGTVCSSEQSLVVDQPVYEPLIAELKKLKAYVLSEEEVHKVSAYAVVEDHMNPSVVGQPAYQVAKQSGVQVPQDTTVLLAPIQGVGSQYPLSHEVLCPLLAVYQVENWQQGCERCLELLHLEGAGHTIVVHATNPDIILEFGLKKPVSRILVNAPSSQGGVGLATGLLPSMTLGCGTSGGNITSDNISAKHLMNIKRVTAIRPDFKLWPNQPISPELTQIQLFNDPSLLRYPLADLHTPAQPKTSAALTPPVTLAQPQIGSSEGKTTPTPQIQSSRTDSSAKPIEKKDPWPVHSYPSPALERFRDIHWP